MKITSLIEELDKIKAEHGDIEVKTLKKGMGGMDEDSYVDIDFYLHDKDDFYAMGKEFLSIFGKKTVRYGNPIL